VTSTSSSIGSSSEAAIGLEKFANFARSRAMGRQNESAEARERRIIADRERKRLARLNENAEARERRMIADKERKRLMRGLETPEQKRLRRELQKKRRLDREQSNNEDDLHSCHADDLVSTSSDASALASRGSQDIIDRSEISVVAGVPTTAEADSLLFVSNSAPVIKPLLSVAAGSANSSVSFKPQAVLNLPSLSDLLTAGSAVANPALEVIVPAGIDLSAAKPQLAPVATNKIAPVCIVANEALPSSSIGGPQLFFSSPQTVTKAPLGAAAFFDARTDPLFTV
jgi:hypothetical protein